MRIVAWLGCVHALPPTLEPNEIRTVHTADGWSLPLRRYVAASEPIDGPPVLLVHGMGASHRNWDYREEVSLAWYLRERGHDVWIASVRGDPDTLAPDRLSRRAYDFDDFAVWDLPATVDVVLAESGHEDLFWVGHSMGGMLLYAALRDRPHLVRAGVAIGSPGVFAEAVPLSALLPLGRPLLGGDRIVPAPAIAGASVWLGRLNPMVPWVGNPDNLDRAVVNGLARDGMVPLTLGMARQVATWVRTDRLLDRSGQDWLVPTDRPVLLLGGSRDHVVAWEDVAATCTVLGPSCTFRLLSVQAGASVDYGHVDPVVGVSASDEVYPVVVSFLADHRER